MVDCTSGDVNVRNLKDRENLLADQSQLECWKELLGRCQLFAANPGPLP